MFWYFCYISLTGLLCRKPFKEPDAEHAIHRGTTQRGLGGGEPCCLVSCKQRRCYGLDSSQERSGHGHTSKETKAGLNISSVARTHCLIFHINLCQNVSAEREKKPLKSHEICSASVN